MDARLLDILVCPICKANLEYRKADLVADGFDPEKTGAARYVRGGKAGYQKLTAAARTAILKGEGRL